MSVPPPKTRRNKSAEITDRLLAKILGGEVVPGQKLPPERELASLFDTNRNTLREALRNLQTMNVVSTRQGDGLRIVDYEREGEINLLPHFLRHTNDQDAQLQVITDMLRLRRLLLCEVSAYTAQRGSDEEKSRLQALVAEQQGNLESPEQLILTDLELAMTMVRSGGSLAYQWIFNTLAHLFVEIAFQWPMLWVYPDDYLNSLERIVAAIVAGDAETVRSLMDRHLERADAKILDVLESMKATRDPQDGE